MRAVLAVLAVLVVTATLGACGSSGDDGTGGCGPVRREELDTRSVHALPGAEDPEYRTDPPTSGPHLPSPSTEDVRSEPVAAPVQVGLLEEGRVLLQHSGLTEAEQAAVEALAGDGVIVAPADHLPEDAAVVATAWVTKQVCAEVDVATLERFATDHVDRGPGDHR